MPPALRLLAPLLLALLAAVLAVGDRPRHEQAGYAPGTRRAGRVVLLVVDSLTDQLAEDPQAFPSLAALRPRALWGRMAGCLPASTVPCTRTLLEGSNAGYLAGLSNFSATRAGPASWPVVAHRAGLRIAVASDHTLVNLCEGLGGPRLQYAVEQIPVFHWDEAAVERASEWLRRDAADALLIHLVDLDKVSHASKVGSELYRREVRDADRAVAAIASLLTPLDSLIVVGDHGHDEFGNHTPNPGYLAVGPAFAPGRLDLSQTTTALLLSAAAATPLPESYDGEVVDRGLTTPFGGSAESRAEIAARVEAQRAERRAGTRWAVWRFMPGLGLALLVLVVLGVERGKRSPAALIGGAAVAVAWLLGSVWSVYGRPLLWQGPARNVLHHSALVVAFVAIATLVLGRLSSVGRAARVGTALLAFPFLVPLVGDDYFGSPKSLARLFVPALALLLHAELLARSAWAFATVGCGAVAVALTLGPVPGGSGWLPSLGAGLGGALLLAWCGEPARRVRTAVASAIVLIVLGAVMDLGARATLALAFFGAATACFARSGARVAPAALSLVGAGAVFLAFWGSLRSLRFDQVRFEFIFTLVPQTGNEARVAVVGAVLTTLKYALLPWVVLSAAPAVTRGGHGPKLAGWLVLAALLHSAWVAGAALDPVSRYYEAGVQAACLLGALALLSVGVLTLRRLLPSAELAARRPDRAGDGHDGVDQDRDRELLALELPEQSQARRAGELHAQEPGAQSQELEQQERGAAGVHARALPEE